MKIKDIVLRETEITSEPMPGAQQLKVDGKPIGTADQATADIMKQAQEKGTLNLGGDDQQTSEGAMSEIHMELSDIVANEDFDALYQLFSANTPAGKYVQDMADDVMIDHRLHPDDDFEQIEEIVFNRLENEFGEKNTDEDIGGDGTGAFINDVRDAEAEAAMGYGPEEGEEPLDEFLGLGNKSPEEWAKTSPQMAKLLQFRAKAVGTPYEKQVEQRIQLLKDRLDMDAGEVAGPGGVPKDPTPPEKFDMKQLREADDDLLEKMRMIAGLR